MNAQEPRHIASFDERQGDDVAMATAGERISIACSTAALETEQVSVRRFDGTKWSDVCTIEDAFHPAVTMVGDVLVVAACVRINDALSVGGRICTLGQPPIPWTVATEGSTYKVAIAAPADREQAWLAWEERRGLDARVQVATLQLDGTVVPVATIDEPGRWHRSPALHCEDGAAWIVWVAGPTGEPGKVHLASLTGSGVVDPVVMDPHPQPQEAPAVTTAGNRVVVAWHSSARGDTDRDIDRWLRLATYDPKTHNIELIAPPHTAPTERANAGEDQGWEFPALAGCPDGSVWVAGRSSHGWHVVWAHVDGRVGERVSISEPWWGGRGRELDVTTRGQSLIVARREPDGVVVSELSPPADKGTDAKIARGQGAPWTVAERVPTTLAGSTILFGDLHQHTAHSDGCGTLEELWLHARDGRGLDFAAITDHDRFCRRAIGPLTWKYMCDLADAFHDEGRFVTFPAYEFTGTRFPGPGHKCIYFGDSVPDRVPDKDLEVIFELLRRHGGIAVPHHVGWTGSDPEHHDPVIQPVWEICSVHGCYESQKVDTSYPPRADCVLPGHFIKDALDAGLRFGFIGSTDSHGLLWHHGITPKRDPFTTGLAGVLDADSNRNGILDAIKARRTYATTGARIAMRVEFDGAPMGSELPAGTNGKLAVAIRGTADLDRVAVVTADREIPIDVSGSQLDVAIDIDGDAARYAYVRVWQADGEMAWSSPMWFG